VLRVIPNLSRRAQSLSANDFKQFEYWDITRSAWICHGEHNRLFAVILNTSSIWTIRDGLCNPVHGDLSRSAISASGGLAKGSLLIK
jgi:hypothetical protein